jgi:hypothetical protein
MTDDTEAIALKIPRSGHDECNGDVTSTDPNSILEQET